MKVAIIGSGAMGCRYGYALQKAGAEVWLYDIWKDHVEAISKKGLIVHTGETSEKVIVHATTKMEEIPKPDLAILFTKSIHTESALAEAKKIINNHTVVMTLQNGLGNIDTIAKYTDRENIIAGITNYASDLLGPGEIEAKGSGITKLMALDGKASVLAEEVNRLLEIGGIHSMISNDVMIDIWEKVAFNAALNTLSFLTFLTVGQLGETKEGFEMAKLISSEVVSVANANGVAASEEKVHGVIQSVFDPEMSGDHKPSMLQDRLMKRKTEIEYICGSVVQEAKKADMEVKYVDSVYKLVKAIEKNYENQPI